MADEWLPEQMKSIKNLTEVVLIIINVGREELLPTILELMLEQIQAVVDEQCCVKSA